MELGPDPNDGIVIPFPMSLRSPRFDFVWRSYDQNTNDVSAESESDVDVELEMNCNLEKTMVSTCPAWLCPHQRLTPVTSANFSLAQ